MLYTGLLHVVYWNAACLYTKHLNKLQPGGGLHEMTKHVAEVVQIYKLCSNVVFLFIISLMSYLLFYSFSSLPYDRSIASSKGQSPHSAI